MNRPRAGAVVGWLLVFGVLAWGWNQSRLVGDLKADQASSSTALADLSANYEALRESVDTNAPPADEIVDDAGAEPSEQSTPVVITEELSAEQVAAAVAAYCGPRNGCRGADGTGPTEADVAAAVAAYCAGGACVGRPGADGTDGPAGPGPTDAQIAAAVNDYCSTPGACTGPAGEDGAPGRGIASLDCVDEQLVVTYTDGTSEPVDGATACEPGGLFG